MLDMQTGQVAYAVLAFGGFLGMGEKLFAVPWQALHLDTVNKRFVLNTDKDRLKGAPGFDKDAWPDMSDMDWANGVHSFYGTDMNSGGAPSMGPGMPMGGMVTGAGTGSSTYTGGSAGASMGSGAGGSMGSGAEGSNMGTGASADPRPGNLGDDKDISKIRGSNIG